MGTPDLLLDLIRQAQRKAARCADPALAGKHRAVGAALVDWLNKKGAASGGLAAGVATTTQGQENALHYKKYST